MAIPFESFWVLVLTTIIILVLISAFLHSVTLSKRRLKAERDFTARVLDSTSALVVVLTEDGKIIRFNQACEAISGCRSNDVLGHSYHEMPILPDGIAEIILEKKNAPRLHHFEKSFRTRDGASRYVYWTVAKISGSNGHSSWTVCTGIDITDRKQAQEERQQFELQLMESQKLESLGLLAGGIAHDFNNLLVGILGNASIALMDLSEDSPVRESVQEIEKAALCVSELTKQMLDYSGKGKLHIQSLDLSMLASEMTHLLESVVTKKAALEINLSQKLPKIDGDDAQIRQVIMNLITNASDALGEGNGTIAVSTGIMEADQAYLAGAFLENDNRAGEYVYIEVADTGCGMAIETTNKIFDPFFTTKFTGRGLGLASVLGIVRGHGGTIKVDSKPGQGTTFRVLFPVSSAHPKLESTADIEKDNVPEDWKGIGTILIVDDEAAVRQVAKRILQKCGFTTLTANDGMQGVEIFRNNAASIVMVLLDLTMPGMNGEEAYQEIRKQKTDTPVILSSGFSEQTAHSRFTSLGFSAFVQKPYKAPTLIRTVYEVLRN